MSSPVQVRQYMSSPVLGVEGRERLSHADEFMRHHNVSGVVVLDGGVGKGMLSRTDLLRAATRFCTRPYILELPAWSVAQLQTTPLIQIDADAPLSAAALMMVEEHVHRLAVQDGERLVGILSTKDMMRAVLEQRIGTPIAAFMSQPLITIHADDDLGGACAKLAEQDVSALVVCEGEHPVGMFTQVEALASRHLPPKTMVEEVMNQAMLALPITTPLFRAAGFAISTSARRVLAVEHHHARGFLSGIDFARALVAPDEDDRVASAKLH